MYTDPELNASDRDPRTAATKSQQLLFTADVLREKGVEVVLVAKVHSKLVLDDDNLYCVGSFSWFSASRDGRYALHETSLVYRGSGLAKEIEIVPESLRQRSILVANKTKATSA